MNYGPTQENVFAIVEKAKTKADGVYRFRGVAYRVVNNRVTHIAGNGLVLERCGWFDVQIGEYKGNDVNGAAALKGLK